MPLLSLFLLNHCQCCRLFLIGQIPEWCSILEWLIDAQEEIDDALSVGVRKVVSQVPFDGGHNFGVRVENWFLFRQLGMMGYRPTILHWNGVSHLIVHLSDFFKQLRIHVNFYIFSKTQLSQLFQTGVISDYFLGKIGAIQRINTICSNGSSLNLDQTELFKGGSVGSVRIIGQFLTRIARKLTCLISKLFNNIKEILWKALHLLFHSLDIIVCQTDLQRLRKFLVQRQVYKVSVFWCHSFLSSVRGFGQIQNVQRVGVLLKEACKVFPCRYCILILGFVQYDVRLRLQRIWYLGPKEGNWTSNLHKGAQHWQTTFPPRHRMPFNNLFNFNMICHVSFMIYASSQIASARKMPITSCNECERERISAVSETSLVYIAVDYWHDPLFAIYWVIKVANQEVIPHHLGVPWRILFQLLSHSIFVLSKLDLLFFLLFVRLAPKEATRGLFRGNRLRSSTKSVQLFLLVFKEAICRIWGTLSVHVRIVEGLYFGKSPIFTNILLSNLSHDILLQWSGQIVGVAEVEAVRDFNLVKNVQIFGLFIFVFLGGTPEKGYHLGLRDLIHRVFPDGGYSFFARNQHDVEAFKKAYKA